MSHSNSKHSVTSSIYEKKIWIISDARRKTDVRWFQENFENSIKTIRIESTDTVRQERGWTFQEGIDDAETECDLDAFEEWDLIIRNNNNEEEFENQMNALVQLCSAQSL